MLANVATTDGITDVLWRQRSTSCILVIALRTLFLIGILPVRNLINTSEVFPGLISIVTLGNGSASVRAFPRLFPRLTLLLERLLVRVGQEST